MLEVKVMLTMCMKSKVALPSFESTLVDSQALPAEARVGSRQPQMAEYSQDRQPSIGFESQHEEPPQPVKPEKPEQQALEKKSSPLQDKASKHAPTEVAPLQNQAPAAEKPSQALPDESRNQAPTTEKPSQALPDESRNQAPTTEKPSQALPDESRNRAPTAEKPSQALPDESGNHAPTAEKPSQAVHDESDGGDDDAWASAPINMPSPVFSDEDAETPVPTPVSQKEVPVLGAIAPAPPKNAPSLSTSAIKNRLRRVFEPRADGSFKVPQRFVEEFRKKGTNRTNLEHILASCGYSADRVL